MDDMVLKPQDVVILIKVHLLGDEHWTYETLGRQLKMSPSTVHQGLRMAKAAGLYVEHSIEARPKSLQVRDLARPYDGIAAGPASSSSAPKSARRGRMVIRQHLLEFLLHGVRFAYPPKRGGMVAGVPTSYAAPPLCSLIVAGNDPIPVWPYPGGQARGLSFEPLYPSVPAVALEDPVFGEWMALIDAIRVGQARERKAAKEELTRRMGLE